MIKDIIAKLGSKKVAGAILVMATLLVGIGVISNFSDDQKIANDAALSRFNDNAFNNFGSSTSRSALERQMSAQQDKNTARFLQGKNTQDGMDEEDAFSSDGAYAEGVNGDEGFVYGDTGTYDPSNPRYVAGAYDEDGNLVRDGFGANGGSMSNRASQGGSYGVGIGGSDDSGDEAGANDAKGAKGKNKGKGKNKVKNAKQTQLNRLAVGNGSSATSSGGSGSSSGISGADINTGSFKDSNKRALPQNNPAEKKGEESSKAFQFGRGGNMGGMNVARSTGGNASGTKGDRGGNSALMDLSNVAAYTGKAMQSKTSAGMKELAMAGFENSDEYIGATIDQGATITGVANQLLSGTTVNNLPNAPKPSDIIPPLEETKNDIEKLNKLNDSLFWMYVGMFAASLAASLVVYFLAKATFPYHMLVAAAAALINEGIISTFLWGGSESINGLIDQIGDLSDEIGVNNNIPAKIAFFWTSFGALTAINVAALAIGAFASAITKAVESIVSGPYAAKAVATLFKFVPKTILSLIGIDAVVAGGHAINKK
ncbi:MAG: hypothetical protein K6E94_02495 [Elusimicrobiaceae bacterium]|nr:hypothetical protein [Elusimicrobiaceae bacterium]